MENTIYTINIGDFKVGETTYENRCLSASFGGAGVESESIPWAEQGNPWDYEYSNGEFIYNPIEIPTPVVEATEFEKVQAQALYTALMTDTLIEE